MARPETCPDQTDACYGTGLGAGLLVVVLWSYAWQAGAGLLAVLLLVWGTLMTGTDR